jgi:hypothetical protein
MTNFRKPRVTNRSGWGKCLGANRFLGTEPASHTNYFERAAWDSRATIWITTKRVEQSLQSWIVLLLTYHPVEQTDRLLYMIIFRDKTTIFRVFILQITVKQLNVYNHIYIHTKFWWLTSNILRVILLRCQWPDRTASNGRTILEWWNDSNASGSGLMEVLFRNLPGGTEAKDENNQSEEPVFQPRLETSIIQMRVCSFTATTARSVKSSYSSINIYIEN